MISHRFPSFWNRIYKTQNHYRYHNSQDQPLICVLSFWGQALICDGCSFKSSRSQIKDQGFPPVLFRCPSSRVGILVGPIKHDEYTFDFLELGEEHSERELERALIAKIEVFLRAMGGMFAFMGSQYRLEVDQKEYFIDLLLFHRRLRCLVAIELKIGEFQPEFVGKMQFYLTALDRQVRQGDENPSIGIILCKEKNRTVVEYALHDAKKPIGVATYEITKTLPRELKGQLPSPKEIADLLEGIEA